MTDPTIDLRESIRRDRDRYLDMLTRFQSGQAKTGEVGSDGVKTDTTEQTIEHIRRVVDELTALLKVS